MKTSHHTRIYMSKHSEGKILLRRPPGRAVSHGGAREPRKSSKTLEKSPTRDDGDRNSRPLHVGWSQKRRRGQRRRRGRVQLRRRVRRRRRGQRKRRGCDEGRHGSCRPRWLAPDAAPGSNDGAAAAAMMVR